MIDFVKLAEQMKEPRPEPLYKVLIKRGEDKPWQSVARNKPYKAAQEISDEYARDVLDEYPYDKHETDLRYSANDTIFITVYPEKKIEDKFLVTICIKQEDK